MERLGVAVVEGRGVWLVGRFANRPYGLAGGLHRWRGLGVGMVERCGGLVGVPRSAPGPHPNPLPPSGRGDDRSG